MCIYKYERYRVEIEAVTEVVMKCSVFWGMTPCSPMKSLLTSWRNMSPPSSGSKNMSSKKLETLKMEATCSSETSVDFLRTARRYIPEESTLQE
jgi:hypothetical protein